MKGGEARGDLSYMDGSSENLQKIREIPQGVSVVKKLENRDIFYLILISLYSGLLSATISLRIQLKSPKWNWLVQ